MAETEKKKTSRKKKSGIGIALWFVCALVLFIIFIANQAKIAANLKSTDFMTKAFGKNPSFVEQAEELPSKKLEKNDVPPVITQVEIDLSSDLPSERTTKAAEPEETVAVQKKDTEEIPSAKEPEKKIYKTEETPSQSESQQAAKEMPKEKAPSQKKESVVKKEISVQTDVRPQTMKIKLFFMAISSSGAVSRHEVIREMKKSDSPLVDAINALISGPIDSEESAGCRSLVSSGTRLIGASVKNGTATLNFSGEFEFNQYGIEGLRGQLQQIVWTATAFPTVEKVQILVDGEKKEYLGSEGVWIGSPLNRMTNF